MPGRFYAYLLANRPCGWLYVGATGDLSRRIAEHKAGGQSGYAAGRGIDRLVWYETYPSLNQAVLREKRIKRWRRAWKFMLVEQSNPRWTDLYSGLPARGAEAAS